MPTWAFYLDETGIPEVAGPIVGCGIGAGTQWWKPTEGLADSVDQSIVE